MAHCVQELAVNPNVAGSRLMKTAFSIPKPRKEEEIHKETHTKCQLIAQRATEVT